MIILASQSPRRKEILQEILKDKEFITIASNFDERSIDDDNLKTLCLKEAINKGLDISKSHQNDIVISADTMVYFEGEKLGKPKDETDAFNTLKRLQNNTHEIVTAYCIIKDNQVLKERITTATLFIEKMSDDEIKKYVETKSPLDKAGSYGVQDDEYIHSKIINGEKSTIMGLSKCALTEDLKELKII